MELLFENGKIVNPIGGPTSCSFCGEANARAIWCVSAEDCDSVRVCWPCAVGVLPALIADAISGPHFSGLGPYAPPFSQELDRILTAYWKAAALALMRQARRIKDRSLGHASFGDGDSSPNGQWDEPGSEEDN